MGGQDFEERPHQSPPVIVPWRFQAVSAGPWNRKGWILRFAARTGAGGRTHVNQCSHSSPCLVGLQSGNGAGVLESLLKLVWSFLQIAFLSFQNLRLSLYTCPLQCLLIC